MKSETEDWIERELVRLVERNGGLCLRWSYPGPSSEPDCIVLLPGGQLRWKRGKSCGRRLSSSLVSAAISSGAEGTWTISDLPNSWSDGYG